MPGSVYAVATMDTKGHELAYLASRLRAMGVEVRTVDVGTLGPPVAPPDIDRGTVLGAASPAARVDPAGSRDRGEAIVVLAEALEHFLVREHRAGDVGGVIGIGGSGGTALITRAMRALPVGLPKLMVSTVASGHTAPYVGCSDITLMYSVVDVAGLNSVSRRIFGNAAAAMAGMVRQPPIEEADRPALGLTMFGVTTPCVTAVREALEGHGYDCLVFHATGTGGQAMEKLVAAGFIRGVLDLTTTEVADLLVGGVFPCGSGRFEPILEARIPFVLSLGALDMVNFGAMASVSEPFRTRRLHVHNPQVTLMRTTPEENAACARWIAAKLNRAKAPFVVLIPEGGVSALDAPGFPFHDPDADRALFGELEVALAGNPFGRVHRLPCHINDQAFAEAAVREFLALVERPGEPAR
ncbi:MAG: Tm-1-like ATP-binding domain-containing protein [Isosphaeraceae bacterium]